MSNPKNYIFKSERLGFRLWENSDTETFAKMNADPYVMQHFPTILTRSQSEDFMQRMNTLYAEKAYCYFAVDVLETNKFIGFIGLSNKDFEADFNPSVDIGWRLAADGWGKGFATEGANSCLKYAHQRLKMGKIISIAPIANKASIKIMDKIGMSKHSQFEHPQLLSNERLKNCVCYEISFLK